MPILISCTPVELKSHNGSMSLYLPVVLFFLVGRDNEETLGDSPCIHCQLLRVPVVELPMVIGSKSRATVVELSKNYLNIR